MAITLPTSPAPRVYAPRLVDARGELRSAFGGGIQRISRLGAKNAFRCVLPAMSHAQALQWQGLWHPTETCILEIPQPGITLTAPGTPLVKGASQAGSSLITDGWTAGFTVPKGLLFSVSVASLLYTYEVQAAVTANGSGEATLSIQPLLRASPADNAALNIDPCKVEGFVTLPDDAREIDVDRLVKGLSFLLEERK